MTRAAPVLPVSARPGAASAEQGALHAAAWFAPLLARGLMGAEEAMAALLAASRGPVRCGDGGHPATAGSRDEGGRAVRLAHALADATDDAERGRGLAEMRVRGAIRPLLDLWAPAAVILAAALAADGAARLDAAEIDDLIAAAMRRRLAPTAAPGPGRGRRR